ncbi:MAG TPA: nucleotidyltransferase domain-containing protein [Candidatus Paceibacterota bacterium]|nr:nucleotidyltransferase domain-containing protein [Candidatus Paceibacterota bacterium]
MERLGAIDAAQRIVSARFPDARAAFLTGSALTTRLTSTSDLDIVVVLRGKPAPFRESIHEHGWLVELFVQSPASIKYFVAKETSEHHAPTLKMLSDGHILVSIDGEAEKLQTEAIERFAKGPSSVSSEEMERRRYALTDQLDDLIGATDPIELLYISQQLLVGASELALLSKAQWLASGKWLPRHLALSEPELSIRLSAAIKAVLENGEKEPIEDVVREILERVGGPLSEGYRVAGEILDL